jgi:Domain of unknown function (DUF222)
VAAAGVTFGGAATLRGGLTPECAAVLRAVVEALGKKAGPEDTRTEHQRFHDALQAGCELLLGAGLVPDRAGASTRVDTVIALSQLRDLPGAPTSRTPGCGPGPAKTAGWPGPTPAPRPATR